MGGREGEGDGGGDCAWAAADVKEGWGGGEGVEVGEEVGGGVVEGAEFMVGGRRWGGAAGRGVGGHCCCCWCDVVLVLRGRWLAV